VTLDEDRNVRQRSRPRQGYPDSCHNLDLTAQFSKKISQLREWHGWGSVPYLLSGGIIS